ncbi:hypothetical protein JT358_15860 [Micrococcales bacterium 31B]|nr:hypothetical protein [Micrococcales bacterium 31B]
MNAWNGRGTNPCTGIGPGTPVQMTSFTLDPQGPLADTLRTTGTGCITDNSPNAPAQRAQIIIVTLTAQDFETIPLKHRETYCSCIPGGNDKPAAVAHRPQAYWTDGSPETLTTTRLGQLVQIEATPTTWHFDFGNGTTATSHHPGTPYTKDPQKQPPNTLPGMIWNVYHHKGTYHISQTITYTARYRVNGGPWQQVPGTITKPGQSVDMPVKSYTALLVAPNY